MAVSVTSSTTKGKPLPEDVLQNTIEACDRALDLDSARKKVLGFVERKMGSIAPNLAPLSGALLQPSSWGMLEVYQHLLKCLRVNVQLLGQKK